MYLKDIHFVQTCGSHPEQYDIRYQGMTLGYLHYRFGVFEINLSIFGEERVLYAKRLGGEYEGKLPAKKKAAVLHDAKKRVAAFYGQHQAKLVKEAGDFDENEPSLIEEAYRPKKSPLQGKRYLFLGSALFAGVLSNGIALPEVLDALYGTSSKKILVEGGDYFAKKNGSYLSSFRAFPAAGEYAGLILEIGGGDELASLPFGGEDSQDPSTLGGTILTLQKEMRERFKGELYLLISPYPENEDYLQEVLFVRQLAQKKGIPLIDFFEPDRPRIHPRDFLDEFHPSIQGWISFWLPEVASLLAK